MMEKKRDCFLRHSKMVISTDKFLAQVDTAVDIFEEKFPHAQALFLFDNAPIHCKSSDDVLCAKHMNVRPGGKQPIMRETVFDGKVQQMVLPDGRPKGLKMVLQERRVDTKGTIAYMVTPHRAILHTNSDTSTLWGVSNHALQF